MSTITLGLELNADCEFAVGVEATRLGYSDAYAGYVVSVSKNGKTVGFREGTATLLNGVGSGEADALQFSPGGFVGHTSGMQRWKIEATGMGHIDSYSLRSNGRWIRVGESTKNGSRLIPGHSHHYDFNF